MVDLRTFSSIFVANWKLNGNIQFLNEYYQSLLIKSENCVVICSSDIYLNKLHINGDNLYTGAQDVSIYNKGPYTGETSAVMLRDNNVDFCIVGHSERRELFKEDNKIIKIKTNNLLDNNIIPIVCIGETLEEKEKKLTKEVLSKQIRKCIPNKSNFKNTIIAYEPIWAIGSGLTPSLQEIDDVHSFIKKLDNKFSRFKILYGGSVNSSNFGVITKLDNVDGCLVGGASLDINEFNKIIS